MASTIYEKYENLELKESCEIQFANVELLFYFFYFVLNSNL